MHARLSRSFGVSVRKPFAKRALFERSQCAVVSWRARSGLHDEAAACELQLFGDPLAPPVDDPHARAAACLAESRARGAEQRAGRGSVVAENENSGAICVHGAAAVLYASRAERGRK